MPDESAPSSHEPHHLETSDRTRLAYHHTPGRAPGVMFLTGFKSDMTGGKALAVEAHCRRRGQACLRFDYRGHGASAGRFEDGTIGAWTADALAVMDALAEGPQVLIGSSMGGWIMLLAALARKDRVAGLLGIAAAPDFTEDLIWQKLAPEQQDAMRRDGHLDMPSEYDEEPLRLAHALIEEGRTHLLLREAIPLACPVRLIQGMRDDDVPWQTALSLADRLETDDVEVQLVKAGGHRLSEPGDIDRLTRTLDRLLDSIG